MSSSKRWNFKHLFTANGRCGCKPKATDVIEPKLKPKTSISDQKPIDHPSSSASSAIIDGDGCTSTPFSLIIDNSPQLCPENDHDHIKCCKTVSPCPKIHNSVAVVKDSDDPYRDFRQSMLQMIFEKEINSSDDLQQLLHCFLDLNAPHHHDIIVQVFMEIWNGGIAVADGGDEKTSPCSSTR